MCVCVRDTDKTPVIMIPSHNLPIIVQHPPDLCLNVRYDHVPQYKLGTFSNCISKLYLMNFIRGIMSRGGLCPGFSACDTVIGFSIYIKFNIKLK